MQILLRRNYTEFLLKILYVNLILFAEIGFYVVGNTRWGGWGVQPKHVQLTLRQFAYVCCITKYNINILPCNIIMSTYEINLLLCDLSHAA